MNMGKEGGRFRLTNSYVFFFAIVKCALYIPFIHYVYSYVN